MKRVKERWTLIAYIYKLKLVVIGISFICLSFLISALAAWLTSSNASHLAVALTRDLADVLLVTGAIGIAIDFFTGRDKDAADTERTRSVLRELAPDFTDAVLRGLSVDKSDLQRVASPELLDDIATTVLSLRLGDDQFASEIYADVRDQAIRAPERWYDVEVNVRLSSINERSTEGAPLLDVLVEWEYTTTPSHSVRRFACVSDRDEFRDLAEDAPATSTWFMAPRPGLDATQRESFELLYFSVDGIEQTVRRQQRKTGQTYTVHMSDDTVRSNQPVRIRHIYRARTAQAGHFLFFEVPQPSRGLSLSVDYDASGISQLRVTDLLTSASRTQIVRKPGITGEKTVSVDQTGWIMPKAGVAVAWTLLSEEGSAVVEPATSAA